MMHGSYPGSVPALGRRARRPAGGGLDDERAKRLAWQTFWAPFWGWSDVPAPDLLGREAPPPADLGLAGEVVVRGLDHVRRRLWLRHALTALMRAVWLGVALGCVWLLVELAGGPALDVRTLAWAAGALGALGIVFAVLARPTRRQTARMLDRSFALQERMTTAVDHLGRGVPRDGQRAPVTYLQMADAANVVAELRRDRALGVRIPVRELVLAIFFGLLMAALFFLRGVGGDIPPLRAGAVPAFTPAVERPPEPEPVEAAADAPTDLPPTVEEVRDRSERSNQARQDLRELARALEDHAVTRPAAEAIGAGEYGEAADELRDLAPSADQLSPGAREELARDLDEAAASMSPDGSNLGQAAQEAASGLREGDQAAQEGVRELGETVERAGSQVASQQDLAEEMRRAEAAEAEGRPQRQPGQQGEQGASDRQPQQGEPQPGQPGQEGPPGEGQPGEGAPGEGQPSDAQPPQGEGQPGEGEPGKGQPGGQPGQQPGGEQGQPGEGESGGQPGGEGAPGEGDGQAPGAGEDASRGGGAGSGESDQAPGEDAAGAGGGDGESEQGAAGVPAEERVSEGSGEGVAAGQPDPVVDTIQLPPGSSDGEGVQTSNDGGGSRQGTGAGVTAGSGSAVQGEVGEAGPDSNRVPPDYRPVVERYFSDDGPVTPPEGEE